MVMVTSLWVNREAPTEYLKTFAFVVFGMCPSDFCLLPKVKFHNYILKESQDMPVGTFTLPLRFGGKWRILKWPTGNIPALLLTLSSPSLCPCASQFLSSLHFSTWNVSPLLFPVHTSTHRAKHLSLHQDSFTRH